MERTSYLFEWNDDDNRFAEQSEKNNYEFVNELRETYSDEHPQIQSNDVIMDNVESEKQVTNGIQASKSRLQVEPNEEPNEEPTTSGIMSHAVMFWITTILVTAGLLAICELYVFPRLLETVSDFFEIGILGSPLFAVIGLIAGNAFWFRPDDGVYGAKNYSLSLLNASAFAIGGFFLTSIGLAIVIGIVVIAIIAGIISLFN